MGWRVDVGVERSDNIGRTSTDEQTETVGIVGLAFDVASSRPRLETSLIADLEYRDYLDQDFESELAGGFTGQVGLSVMPERLIWVLEDNYGQIPVERQLPDSPTNRQQLNYFSTGPDVILPLGARTNLRVSGRWSDTYLEDSLEDNETLSGSLALARQLSQTTIVSVNGTTSKVEFDEPELFVDYEVQQGFLRLEVVGSRTTLTTDVGASVYKADGQSSDESGDSFLARVDVTRRVGARSLLIIALGTQPSNTADTFRRDQTLGGIEVGSDAAVPSGDLYRADYAYLTWRTEWERSAIAAVLSARTEEHARLTELDRDQYRAGLTWSRELSRTVYLTLNGGYLDEQFVSGIRFKEWGGGAGLRWDLSPRFALIARINHVAGTGDAGSRDYTENRAYLGVSYGRSSGLSAAGGR